MDISELMQRGIDYSRANPAVAVSVVVIVLFLLFRKPKFLLLLIFLALAAAVLNYLFDKISSTGLQHKKAPFLD